MKWNKFVSMAFYVLLMLLLGNAVQAQSQVSRKSSKKVLKQEQKVEQEVNYEHTTEADETAIEGRKGRKVEQGERAKSNKEGHPGKGHAYGKYKDKRGKAHARGKYKHKNAKASMKDQEKAGKQRLEKRKIGKAYSKTRKDKSSKAKVKRTSRTDIPVQEN